MITYKVCGINKDNVDIERTFTSKNEIPLLECIKRGYKIWNEDGKIGYTVTSVFKDGIAIW